MYTLFREPVVCQAAAHTCNSVRRSATAKRQQDYSSYIVMATVQALARSLKCLLVRHLPAAFWGPSFGVPSKELKDVNNVLRHQGLRSHFSCVHPSNTCTRRYMNYPNYEKSKLNVSI